MSDNIYSPDYVRGLFNRMSASYERMNYIFSFGFSLRWRNQFIAKVSPSDDNIAVMDLLTGMGEEWMPIRKRFPHAELHALDFSDGMMQYAEVKNHRKMGGSVKLLLQNILQNDLPSASYDRVVCGFGLKTFDKAQMAQFAQEIHRILKPGGEFSLIEVSAPPNRLLRFLYGLHLGLVVPLAGRLLLGNPREYRMLWRYTSAFVSTQWVLPIFQNAGLETQTDVYFFGCATGLHGRKVA